MATEQTKQEKRAIFVRNYIETSLSENQIRQMYALFLSGDRTKYMSKNRVLIAEMYLKCPRELQATATRVPYDEIIEYLINNWDKK